MTDGYFIHVPFNETMLKPGERIACRNATIIEDSEGRFSAWVNNDGAVAVWEET